MRRIAALECFRSLNSTFIGSLAPCYPGRLQEHWSSFGPSRVYVITQSPKRIKLAPPLCHMFISFLVEYCS